MPERRGLIVLAVVADRPVARVAAAAGAAAAFVRYNLPPARIFLGDCGSLMLGFLLAGLSVALVVPAASPIPWSAAALIVAMPAIDFLLVHVDRYRYGLRSPAALITSTRVSRGRCRRSAALWWSVTGEHAAGRRRPRPALPGGD